MRDPGLDEAVRAAGGGGALAKKIGISQPSVSNWAQTPAERVLSVEAVTGVDRTILRPDLYAEHQSAVGGVDDAGGLLRVHVDERHARHIARVEDADKRMKRLAGLRGDATPLGLAHAALADAASRTSAERVEREYFDLFIGLGRGELLPYARITSPGSCMSGRWRGCASISPSSESNGGGPGRARRSCRHPVRGHGRACQPALRGSGGRRSRVVRGASRVLIGQFFADLEREGGRRLPPNRNARPGVHGDRDGGLRCRLDRRAYRRPKEGYGDEKQRKTTLGRREFLRTLGMGAAAAGAGRSPTRPTPTPKAMTRSARRVTARPNT
jgi:DNA-binding transcriptional regulator YdaS (Cro superfamily)